MKIMLYILLIFVFLGCKKEEVPEFGYQAHYNIVDGDTISAIYIPSGFTPDGDGNNDIFLPVYNNCTLNEMKIHTTTNNIVYITNVGTKGWDGTSKSIAAENGIYFYAITATDSTGFIYEIQDEFYLIR
jgi:gliding motility-associated-like protein